MVLKTETLMEIMDFAFSRFQQLERVSIYGKVKDIIHKSEDDLLRLKEAGLDIVYIGLESGSDEIIQNMDKNQSQEEFVEAIQKLKKVGLRSSVTLIAGSGSVEQSSLHIKESAKAITLSKPDYVSFLSLQLPKGVPLFDDVEKGDFTLLNDEETLAEIRSFIEQVDSEGTVFRSNHASNPVAIRGTFNRDREAILKQIDEAVEHEAYRPKGYRGF